MKTRHAVRTLVVLVALLAIATVVTFAVVATAVDGDNYVSRTDKIYLSAGDLAPEWWEDGAKSATLYWLWEIRKVYVPFGDAGNTWILSRADTTLISADTSFAF